MVADDTRLSLHARRLIKYCDPLASQWHKKHGGGGKEKQHTAMTGGANINFGGLGLLNEAETAVVDKERHQPTATELGVSVSTLAKLLAVVHRIVEIGGSDAIYTLLKRQESGRGGGGGGGKHQIDNVALHNVSAAVAAAFGVPLTSPVSSVFSALPPSSSRGNNQNQHHHTMTTTTIVSHADLMEMDRTYSLGVPIELLTSIAERFVMAASPVTTMAMKECISAAGTACILDMNNNNNDDGDQNNNNNNSVFVERSHPTTLSEMLPETNISATSGGLLFHPLCRGLCATSFLWMTPAVSSCDQLDLEDLHHQPVTQHSLRDFSKLGDEWLVANRCATLELAASSIGDGSSPSVVLGSQLQQQGAAVESIYRFLEENSSWLGAAAVHLHEEQAPTTFVKGAATGTVTPFVIAAFGSLLAYVAPATHLFDSTSGGGDGLETSPATTAAVSPFLHTMRIAEAVGVRQGGQSISLMKFKQWVERAGIVSNSSSSGGAGGGGKAGGGVVDAGVNGDRSEVSLWASHQEMRKMPTAEGASSSNGGGGGGTADGEEATSSHPSDSFWSWLPRSEQLELHRHPLVVTGKDGGSILFDTALGGGGGGGNIPGSGAAAASHHHHHSDSVNFLAHGEQPFTLYRLLVLKHVWRLTFNALQRSHSRAVGSPRSPSDEASHYRHTALVAARMASKALEAHHRHATHLPPSFGHQQLLFLIPKEQHAAAMTLHKELAQTVDRFPLFAKILHSGFFDPKLLQIIEKGSSQQQHQLNAMGLSVNPTALHDALRSFALHRVETLRHSHYNLDLLRSELASQKHSRRVQTKAAKAALLRRRRAAGQSADTHHRHHHRRHHHHHDENENGGGTSSDSDDYDHDDAARITPAAQTLLVHNFVGVCESLVAFSMLRSSEVVHRAYLNKYKGIDVDHVTAMTASASASAEYFGGGGGANGRTPTTGDLRSRDFPQMAPAARLPSGNLSDAPPLAVQFPSIKWKAANPDKVQHFHDPKESPFNTKEVVTEGQIYVSPAVAALLKETTTLSNTVSTVFEPRVAELLAQDPAAVPPAVAAIVHHHHHQHQHPAALNSDDAADVQQNKGDDSAETEDDEEAEMRKARAEELRRLRREIKTLSQRCRALHQTFKRKSVFLPAALAAPAVSSGGAASPTSPFSGSDVDNNNIISSGSGSGGNTTSMNPLQSATDVMASSSPHIDLASIERRTHHLRQRKELLDSIKHDKEELERIEQDGDEALAIRNEMLSELERSKLENKRHLKDMHSSMQTQLDDVARHYAARLGLVKAKETRRQSVLQQATSTFVAEILETNAQWDKKESALPNDVRRVDQLLNRVRRDAELSRMSPIGRWDAAAKKKMSQRNGDDNSAAAGGGGASPLYGRTFTPLAILDIIGGGGGNASTSKPTATTDHRSVSVANSHVAPVSRGGGAPNTASISLNTSLQQQPLDDDDDDDGNDATASNLDATMLTTGAHSTLGGGAAATATHRSNAATDHHHHHHNSSNRFATGVTSVRCMSVQDFCAMANTRRRRGRTQHNTTSLVAADDDDDDYDLHGGGGGGGGSALTEQEEELLHIGAVHGWMLPFDWRDGEVAPPSSHQQQQQQQHSVTVRCALRRDW